MKQQTLTGFAKYGKPTRPAQFLADMNRIIRRQELAAPIESVSQRGPGGRRPISLEPMLQRYHLQLWFKPSDPVVGQALYDSLAMRIVVEPPQVAG